jgi:hypothetical protein
MLYRMVASRRHGGTTLVVVYTREVSMVILVWQVDRLENEYILKDTKQVRYEQVRVTLPFPSIGGA